MSDSVQVLRIVSDYVHLVKFAIPLNRCHSSCTCGSIQLGSR